MAKEPSRPSRAAMSRTRAFLTAVNAADLVDLGPGRPRDEYDDIAFVLLGHVERSSMLEAAVQDAAERFRSHWGVTLSEAKMRDLATLVRELQRGDYDDPGRSLRRSGARSANQ